ncbi:unnamed protein product, partial [Mesorhabditis spiculigera]
MSASPWHAIRNIPLSELRGRRLRFLVPSIEPPYVNYVNFSQDAVKDMGYGPGVVIEIMKDVGKILNLTYELVSTNDTKWGNLINGSWNGAFGKLYRGETDMISGAAIMQYDRSLISDLTYPFEFELTGMLIRSPMRYLDHPFLIVTQPFKWEVWGLTLIAILLSGVVLKYLTTTLGALGEQQYSAFDSVWIFFSIFVQQGLPRQPYSWTCRFLLALWWLSAMTLMATFTAAEGMLKAIKAGHYTMLMDVNSQSRTEMIAKSNASLFRALWHEMSVNKKVKYVDGLEKGVELVKSNVGYVLVASMVSLEYYAFVDCQLSLIPEGFLPTYLSIPLQKNSPFSTFFSNRIQELNERGFIQKWMKDYQIYLASRRTITCNTTTSENAFLFLIGEYGYHLFRLKHFEPKIAPNSAMASDNVSTSKSSRSFGGPSRQTSIVSPETGEFSRRRNVLNLTLPIGSMQAIPPDENYLENPETGSPNESLDVFDMKF